MKNKHNNVIFYILPASVLLLALTYYIICLDSHNLKNRSSADAVADIHDNNDQDPEIESIPYTSSEESNSNIIDSDGASSISESKLISINNRCHGCGKCAQIDAEHFLVSGRKASVISNSNLTSSRLQTAINLCPEDAISLS